eukprot:1800945-Prorocentrum_lima.AAC.1
MADNVWCIPGGDWDYQAELIFAAVWQDRAHDLIAVHERQRGELPWTRETSTTSTSGALLCSP